MYSDIFCSFTIASRYKHRSRSFFEAVLHNKTWYNCSIAKNLENDLEKFKQAILDLSK